MKRLPLLLVLTAAVAHAEDQPLLSSIVRINGKRHKKIAQGTAFFYVPSLGQPFAQSLNETVCPKTLSAKDEVLEISKPQPADAEIQGLSKEIAAQFSSCAGASQPTAKAGTVIDCEPTTAAPSNANPKLDPSKPQPTASAVPSFGCKKNFTKP